MFILWCCLCMSCVGYTQEVRIKLENCKLDSATLAHIKSSLNFQLGFYAGIFKDKTKNSFKARVFGSEREFLKYSKSKADFNPVKGNAIAFYSHDLNEMILHTEIDNFAHTFSHELSHAILHYYCKKAETWLHEGLAEMLEDVIAADTVYTFDDQQIDKIRYAKTLLLSGTSLQDVVDSRDFYNKGVSHRNYTLSWATVIYLYRTNSELLSKLITSNCQNREEFINRTYPGGLALLTSDVKSFFLNIKPNPN